MLFLEMIVLGAKSRYDYQIQSNRRARLRDGSEDESITIGVIK